MSTSQSVLTPELRAVMLERDEAVAELERAQTGVTVCITYHNEPLETLRRAVESVNRQTVRPYETIIVDDGSDVPLIDIAYKRDEEGNAQTWTAFSRIVRVTNRGLPAARNTGLMLARAGAFLPLDADDWLDPTYIEKTLPLLADADVVLTGLQEHGPTRNGTYMPGYDRPWRDVTWELLISDFNRFFYCSLFRTAVLRETGGYHPMMAGWPGHVQGGFEDWDLWIHLLRDGRRFAAVEEPLFNYDTSNPGSMLGRAESNRAALVSEMRRHHYIKERGDS